MRRMVGSERQHGISRSGAAAGALLALLLASGCGADRLEAGAPERDGFVPLDDYYIVNCVLPGQIRRFGQMTQVTKPRPARLEAYLCRLRGGQYIEFDRADLTTSVSIWETLAESGDADAQLMLGRLYERGGGGEPDFELAARWYSRGAEAGSDPAKLALASLYERGLGVSKDMDRALRLYREALGLSESEELVRRNVEDAREAERQAELQLARQEIEKLQEQNRDLEQRVERSRANARQLQQEADRLRAETAGNVGRSATPQQQEVEAQLAQVTNELQQLQQQQERIKGNLAPPQSTPAPPQSTRRLITQVPSPEMVPSATAAALGTDVNFGRFFALVVTVDRPAEQFADLSASLSDVLRRRYSFNVTTLRNPSGSQLFAAVTLLKEQLKPEDNLLVFFAGESRALEDSHGSKMGHWLVADSTSDNHTWIPHDQVSEHLSMLPARRVLLVTTGPFDNGLARLPMPAGFAGGLDKPRLTALLARRARIVISGGFLTSALTGLLKNNTQVIDAPALWTLLSQQGVGAASPELGLLQPGSDGGQFFMVPKDLIANTLEVGEFEIVAGTR